MTVVEHLKLPFGRVFSKMISRNLFCQFKPLDHIITDASLACNWRLWTGRYVVSTIRPILTLLLEKFPERVITRWQRQLAAKVMRFGGVRLFLRGYAKDSICADISLTLEHLKTNIRQVMPRHPPKCKKTVVKNYLKRTDCCNQSRGGHLNDIVFHT